MALIDNTRGKMKETFFGCACRDIDYGIDGA
jgi:hypothetical protein